MLESTWRSVALALGVAAVSFLFVGGIRRYALERGLLDVPQDRSSHVVPTPRGGGAGLVIAAILGFMIVAPIEPRDWRLALALLAVLPTAVAGWIDDHGSLPVLPRFAAHLASGLLMVPLATVSGLPLHIALLLGAGWVFATVSAINVVNFMDGIDGLIGLQALVFAAHLAVIGGDESMTRILGLALAAASAGFLLWNWSPARIFLGDVGSGALAVLGMVGAILAWRTSAVPFVAIVLPLFAICLDATVAIWRRARRQESLAVAHRTHLYQRLANEGQWGHARVSLLYGVVAAFPTIMVVLLPTRWIFLGSICYMTLVTTIGWALDRTVPILPSSVAGHRI